MSKLVLATGNRSKLAEIMEIVVPLGIKVVPQSEFAVPEVEESGLSFVENAILKARNAARHSGLPALADDSGLEVDALHGAPGIYSARYAGDDRDDQANNRLLLSRLAGIPADKRTARFQCVIVFLRRPDDPVPLICHADWEGRIIDRPKGENGFGYDPLFLVDGMQLTSAELSAEEKNRISHRGRALAMLAGQLRVWMAR
ncbi:MAG: RdgB/HAM1 family non-canonical purine NTP pyrophosphatase [Proteobacteria bacterium]|nr:RdgB/HAM1 family non-canonical purine NTP pyrophosphatase [Pseudomonadota bacterium]